MTPSPSDQKALLRKWIADELALLTDTARERGSEALVAHLKRFAFQRFSVVLATLPFAGEPNLVPFLRWWLEQGQGVALARTGPGRSLSFRYVASLDGPWEAKSLGLREPLATATAWTPGPPTLALVPGLGFSGSPAGVARLGRGAGYYDRWLAAHGREIFALGVGFQVQWVESVPMEDHDRPLDAWLGPRGLWSADNPSNAPRTEG